LVFRWVWLGDQMTNTGGTPVPHGPAVVGGMGVSPMSENVRVINATGITGS